MSRTHHTRAQRVAAVDLGAESGRVAVVAFDGERLHLDVAHRFAHAPLTQDGILRWDLDHVWGQVLEGLGFVDAGTEQVRSVGVDSWGVDYGLLDREGRLVDTPTCYRDPRNVAAMRGALTSVGPEALYDATGVQIIAINTLFSLVSDVRDHAGRIAAADRLLMLPDVVHHLLSGSTVTEYTAASTTGALDMRTGQWATGLLDELGIPSRLMPEVVAPGTDLGPLLGGFDGALAGARVVAPPAHDTASAVVGTPFREPHEMFISSGTWSLVGVESPRAVVSPASRSANLTNEGGYAGTIRLLSNVMGLWLLQGCRRQWAGEGRELTYQQIADLAAAEPGLRSIINPDADEFLAPGDLPARIRDYCRRSGQPVPESVGAVARCVIDSLALGYRGVADAITAVTGRRPGAVVVTGGGSSHRLLSQLTADATGLPVRCGPVEATALGNGAVQLASLGELGGLEDIRRVVAASTEIVAYEPAATSVTGHDWDAAAELFAGLVRRDQTDAGLLRPDAIPPERDDREDAVQT
jgi:rhamnulokinase